MGTNKVAPRPWDVARPGPKLPLFHPDRGAWVCVQRKRTSARYSTAVVQRSARLCVCVFGGGISLLKNRSPGPTDPSYKWTRVKLISATKSQPIPRGLLYTLRSDRSTMEVDEHRTSTVPACCPHLSYRHTPRSSASICRGEGDAWPSAHMWVARRGMDRSARTRRLLSGV